MFFPSAINKPNRLMTPPEILPNRPTLSVEGRLIQKPEMVKPLPSKDPVKSLIGSQPSSEEFSASQSVKSISFIKR